MIVMTTNFTDPLVFLLKDGSEKIYQCRVQPKMKDDWCRDVASLGIDCQTTIRSDEQTRGTGLST